MKQFLTSVLVFLFVFSLGCKKDSNNPSTSNDLNTVKLTIDGKEYVASIEKSKASLNSIWIECGINKYQTYAAFYMLIMGPNSPFTIGILLSKGPTNGLGTFTITEGSLTENFSGGLAYTIQSGNFIVTKSDVSLIEGTLTFNLKNPTKTKTVTGSFKITAPI